MRLLLWSVFSFFLWLGISYLVGSSLLLINWSRIAKKFISIFGIFRIDITIFIFVFIHLVYICEVICTIWCTIKWLISLFIVIYLIFSQSSSHCTQIWKFLVAGEFDISRQPKFFLDINIFSRLRHFLDNIRKIGSFFFALNFIMIKLNLILRVGLVLNRMHLNIDIASIVIISRLFGTLFIKHYLSGRNHSWSVLADLT